MTQESAAANGEEDDAAWARTHQACFEAEPLVELRGPERIPVGFVLTLYALVPMDKAPGAERRDAAGALLSRLRHILESTLAEAGVKARVEVEAPGTAAVLRPENELKPEVALKARVVHDDDTFRAVTPDERQHLSAFEKRLTARGLRSGRW